MKIGFHRFESTENQPSFLPVRKMLNAFDLCKAYEHENWNEPYLREPKTNLRFCLLFSQFLQKSLYNIRTLGTFWAQLHFNTTPKHTKTGNKKSGRVSEATMFVASASTSISLFPLNFKHIAI